MGRRNISEITSTRGSRLLGLSLGALAALLALGPAGAAASTVSKSGTTLTYTAANNETNQTVVSLSGANYKFSDSGATVAVGAGCTSADAHTANCASAGITGITINSGNLNDLAWETASVPTTVFGGDGNDTMIGGNANDVLIGCLGNDTYNGGGGADTMVDGAFCSGGGNDTVDYSSRTQTVFVTLDGTANDGGFGEGDNVGADVENVTGGSGDDDLTGSSVPNTIIGNAGDDGIDGGPGNDLLSGGNDDDMITGGAGADIIQTGSGDNDVEAADGEIDQITCGTGFDVGTADPSDHFNPSCDALDTSGGGDFGGDDFGSDDFGDDGDFTDQLPAGPCDSLRVAHRPVDLQDRAVTIKLRQPRRAHRACKGTLKLEGVSSARATKSPDIRWGSASFSVKAGKGKAVQVHISPKGRGVISRSHKVTVLAQIIPKGGGDGPSSVIVLQSS